MTPEIVATSFLFKKNEEDTYNNKLKKKEMSLESARRNLLEKVKPLIAAFQGKTQLLNQPPNVRKLNEDRALIKFVQKIQIIYRIVKKYKLEGDFMTNKILLRKVDIKFMIAFSSELFGTTMV